MLVSTYPHLAANITERIMVQLVKISEAEYQTWLERTIVEYAEEKVRAGNWKEDEALKRSEKAFRELLPGGVDTADQHLCSIIDEASGCSVGVLWFAREDRYPKPVAYVFDLLVYEPYRRQGYAEQAMLAMENQVKAMGLDEISLHVFGHNWSARHLYEKLGYETTNVYMSKKLCPGGEEIPLWKNPNQLSDREQGETFDA